MPNLIHAVCACMVGQFDATVNRLIIHFSDPSSLSIQLKVSGIIVLLEHQFLMFVKSTMKDLAELSLKFTGETVTIVKEGD